MDHKLRLKSIFHCCRFIDFCSIILICFCMTGFLPSYSQRYNFTTYTIADGLPNNQVFKFFRIVMGFYGSEPQRGSAGLMELNFMDLIRKICCRKTRLNQFFRTAKETSGWE